MNRSPLFYPMARGMDNEAGGAADLQTDVMRFMAILSLCLMVIFALVQSVPVETVRLPTPEAAITQPPPMVARKAIQVPPAPVVPAKADSKPVPPPPPAKTAVTSDPPEGFTLRFENDLALTQLVARNEVGLYAVSPDGAMRMTINRDKAEFWSASVPRKYHEMDSTTVPEAVIRAFNASSAHSDGSIKWGVTLPAVMSGKLNTYMQEYRGGSLVIGANGTLTMEPQ